MATDKRLHDGVGMIGAPPQLVVGQDGKVTAQLISMLNLTLQDLVRKVNGRLSLGSGEHLVQSGNLDGQWVEVTTGMADTEVQVPHNLGRRPVDVFPALPDKAGVLYKSNFAGWNDRFFYIKCTVAQVTWRLFVF